MCDYACVCVDVKLWGCGAVELCRLANSHTAFMALFYGDGISPQTFSCTCIHQIMDFCAWIVGFSGNLLDSILMFAPTSTRMSSSHFLRTALDLLYNKSNSYKMKKMLSVRYLHIRHRFCFRNERSAKRTAIQTLAHNRISILCSTSAILAMFQQIHTIFVDNSCKGQIHHLMLCEWNFINVCWKLHSNGTIPEIYF